jgi:hypothetical protein
MNRRPKTVSPKGGSRSEPGREAADHGLNLARSLLRLPSLLAIGLIRVYQLLISPMLGPTCRFAPSCSHYACACLRDHGMLRGSALTLRRLSRCHPWHPGGFDPPPPAIRSGVAD